jgi:hypothetical protein
MDDKAAIDVQQDVATARFGRNRGNRGSPRVRR